MKTITAAEYRAMTAAPIPRRTLVDMRDKPAKPAKYRNHVVVVDGMKFDSKAEYRYWCSLVLRAKARAIFDLRRQVPFVIAPSATYGGAKHRAVVYIADMTYREGSPTGPMVVADVKGCITDVYALKRHLMFTVHGIEVLEIKRT
jgi:hypothetical protein